MQLLESYVHRLEEIFHKEKELDELEYELNTKAEDLSFETRSSESTQPLIYSKNSFQKQFLRDSLSKIENKGEDFSRYSCLSKFKRDVVLKLKSQSDNDLKNFSLENDIFLRTESTFNIFKQQVLRRKKILDQQKGEINNEHNLLEELYKKNDTLLAEIKNMKKSLLSKKKRVNIETYNEKVCSKEDEVLILRESVQKNEKMSKNYKLKIVTLEKKLKRKNDSIKYKTELLEILDKIEREIQNKVDFSDLNSSSMINIVEQRKNNIKSLIQQALHTEREISLLEKELI